MNKLQFLAELKSNIHMLEDEEQTDILDEYSQHVDMKVAAGMSEEEAIAEFGPVDELIEEILAAYHVKAPEKKADVFDTSAHHGLAEGGKQAIGVVTDAAKKGCSRVKEAAGNALSKTKATAARNRAGMHSDADFSAEGGFENSTAGGSGANSPAAGIGARSAKAVRGLASSAARGTTSLGDLCARLVKTCVRWCWNAFAICCALAALFGAICALFSFGFCVVLMFQGYPLIGVTIALFGGTVALAFASLLFARLIVLKRREAQTEQQTPIPNNAGSNVAASMNADTFHSQKTEPVFAGLGSTQPLSRA